jgi:hypothetical protein
MRGFWAMPGTVEYQNVKADHETPALSYGQRIAQLFKDATICPIYNYLIPL